MNKITIYHTWAPNEYTVYECYTESHYAGVRWRLRHTTDGKTLAESGGAFYDDDNLKSGALDCAIAATHKHHANTEALLASMSSAPKAPTQEAYDACARELAQVKAELAEAWAAVPVAGAIRGMVSLGEVIKDYRNKSIAGDRKIAKLRDQLKSVAALVSNLNSQMADVTADVIASDD